MVESDPISGTTRSHPRLESDVGVSPIRADAMLRADLRLSSKWHAPCPATLLASSNARKHHHRVIIDMRDLRFAFRQLLKSPGFACIAILTLALGIGACTMVFSWIRAVLIDTVPGAHEPGRLVVLAPKQTDGTIFDTLSLLDGTDLAAETNIFEGVIGSQMEAVSLRIDKEVEWLWAQPTTANFFDVLGVAPVLGRGFRPEEDKSPRGNPVVVISYQLWERRFHRDPGVLGRSVEISRRPFTIIGVAPREFRGTMGGLGFDLWIPITMSTEFEDIARALQSRDARWVHTMARLRPGVSVVIAQAAASTAMRRLESAYPTTNRNTGVAVLPLWKAPYGAQARLLPLLTALGAVALLLLTLVISNVANLLLARATSRESEMAVRLALGAASTRLIRQTLIESLVLAAFGGALGCLLAVALRWSLLWMIPVTYLPVDIQFPVDGQVLLFTAITTVATGLLFGVVPAWRASRANVAEVLKAGGRTGEPTRHAQKLRQALVIAEIAAAFVILVGMTLCARSFEKARAVYVGFEPRDVWVAGFRLPPGAYSREEASSLFRRLRSELQNLPGVEAVALADWLPLGFEGGSSTDFGVPGYDAAPGEDINAGVSVITADYFATLKIPLLRGREFDNRDQRDSAHTVVINEQLARRYFRDRDPLGQKLQIWGEPRTIIGVARTGKYRGLNEAPRSYLFLPLEQIGDYSQTVIVRARGSLESVGKSVEQVATGINPHLKPMAAMPLTQYVAAAYLIPKTAAVLLSVLGAIAVLLAALGIYGVIAWSVGRRVREVGVRMALGAQPREVAWLFVAHGLRLMAVAVVLGILGAVLASRVLGTLLVDVSSSDPITYLVAVLVLGLVVFLACWLPARRAARIDPITALRTE